MVLKSVFNPWTDFGEYLHLRNASDRSFLLDYGRVFVRNVCSPRSLADTGERARGLKPLPRGVKVPTNEVVDLSMFKGKNLGMLCDEIND